VTRLPHVDRGHESAFVVPCALAPAGPSRRVRASSRDATRARKASRHKVTEREFMLAYLTLFLVPPGEGEVKIVSLARFGSYEARLIELVTLPPEPAALYLELYAHDTCASLDSFRCSEFDEAVVAADAFVARAREMHDLAHAT
jgi:hypothetical protein